MAFVADSKQNSFRKAQAFLNIFVRDKDGTERKLGAIPLRDDGPVAQRALLKCLREDKGDKIEQILSKASFTTVLVRDDEGDPEDLF